MVKEKRKRNRKNEAKILAIKKKTKEHEEALKEATIAKAGTGNLAVKVLWKGAAKYDCYSYSYYSKHLGEFETKDMEELIINDKRVFPKV